MVVNLPLRGPSVIRAGVARKRVVRRKVGRGSKRRSGPPPGHEADTASRCGIRRSRARGRTPGEWRRPAHSRRRGAGPRAFRGSARAPAGGGTHERQWALYLRRQCERQPRVALRLRRHPADASRPERGHRVGQGGLEDPRAPTAASQRPSGQFLGQAEISPRPRRRQAGRVSGRAVRPLADLPHHPHRRRWRGGAFVTASGARVG